MGFILYLLPIALQVVLIVHVFRTGRERYWIFIIFFLPVAGSVAYLILEVLPPLLSGRGAHTLRRKVSRLIDPAGRMRELEARLELTPTVANRTALAEACVDAGDPARAAALYESCLSGVYRNDPKITAALGRCLGLSGDAGRAVEVFDRLLAERGRIEAEQDRLAYGAALEAVGRTDEAEKLFAEAAETSATLAARHHYAVFLKRRGREADAGREAAKLFAFFERLPGYIKKNERPLLEKIRREFDA